MTISPGEYLCNPDFTVREADEAALKAGRLSDAGEHKKATDSYSLAIKTLPKSLVTVTRDRLYRKKFYQSLLKQFEVAQSSGDMSEMITVGTNLWGASLSMWKVFDLNGHWNLLMHGLAIFKWIIVVGLLMASALGVLIRRFRKPWVWGLLICLALPLLYLLASVIGVVSGALPYLWLGNHGEMILGAFLFALFMFGGLFLFMLIWA